MKTIYCFLVFTIILFAGFICGCEQFIEVDSPETSLTDNSVFFSDETAESAIVGIYVEMVQSGSSFLSGEDSFTWLGSLSSDELTGFFNDDRKFFEHNQLSADNEFLLYQWRQLYSLIYSTNAILEGIAGSKAMTASGKTLLEGEAKFIRAFLYYYLVSFWGDVPLVITTDYEENALMHRSSSSKVYNQIIEDLIDAKRLLPKVSEAERTRPCRAAAKALLARVYLHIAEWKNAEAEAATIIDQKGIYSLEDDLNNVFRKDSREVIWQVQPVVSQINTWDGYRFILVGAPTRVVLKQDLINIFEVEDKRLASWVNSFENGDKSYYYPFKYKIRYLPVGQSAQEYMVVFRLAEQFLIRAEARVEMGDFDGARADLNVIRNRAGLSNIATVDEAVLRLAIQEERRRELFTESGHRWLDLKRTGQANSVLAPIKPDWQPTDQAYPIPLTEIERNPKLTQNEGY